MLSNPALDHSTDTKLFGLVGTPLGHSASCRVFNALFALCGGSAYRTELR